MGKHTTHRVPTCKKCGTEHYNMRPCPETTVSEPVVVAPVYTHLKPSFTDAPRTVAQTGGFYGERIDKHPPQVRSPHYVSDR